MRQYELYIQIIIIIIKIRKTKDKMLVLEGGTEGDGRKRA